VSGSSFIEKVPDDTLSPYDKTTPLNTAFGFGVPLTFTSQVGSENRVPVVGDTGVAVMMFDIRTFRLLLHLWSLLENHNSYPCLNRQRRIESVYRVAGFGSPL